MEDVLKSEGSYFWKEPMSRDLLATLHRRSGRSIDVFNTSYQISEETTLLFSFSNVFKTLIEDKLKSKGFCFEENHVERLAGKIPQ